jgi:hypothetical protein
MCAVSEEGRAVLNGLCAGCEDQLQQQDDVQHMVLLLDPEYVCALQQGQGRGRGDKGAPAKRRMSKMERKRLSKQGLGASVTGVSKSSSSHSASPNGVAGENEDDSSSAEASLKEATIVLRIMKAGKYRSDFLMSFITQEDVCRSYAAAVLA